MSLRPPQNPPAGLFASRLRCFRSGQRYVIASALSCALSDRQVAAVTVAMVKSAESVDARSTPSSASINMSELWIARSEFARRTGEHRQQSPTIYGNRVCGTAVNGHSNRCVTHDVGE